MLVYSLCQGFCWSYTDMYVYAFVCLCVIGAQRVGSLWPGTVLHLTPWSSSARWWVRKPYLSWWVYTGISLFVLCNYKTVLYLVCTVIKDCIVIKNCIVIKLYVYNSAVYMHAISFKVSLQLFGSFSSNCWTVGLPASFFVIKNTI